VKRQYLFGRVTRGLGVCGFLTLTAVALSQNAPDHPVTDSAKIADALRAGPAFITKDATILDWPQQAGGEYRVLRKGKQTNGLAYPVCRGIRMTSLAVSIPSSCSG
jgi:hypothetical protein